jgi:Domain of unknown function (DUF4258)
LPGSRLVFRLHAVQRMFRRRIGADEVRAVIEAGEVIASYPDDTPYPSRLVLGWSGSRPLHVVVADNAADRELIVITVYEPDPALWDETFRRRRQPS